jgi:hypothetical protein
LYQWRDFLHQSDQTNKFNFKKFKSTKYFKSTKTGLQQITSISMISEIISENVKQNTCNVGPGSLRL